MDIEMTKEAAALLCLLYANYKRRNKEMPRDDARNCGDLDDIQKLVCNEFHIEDLNDLCRELQHNGFLDLIDGDDVFISSELTTKAISFMQSKTKQEIRKIVLAVFTYLPPVISWFL